MRKNSPCWLVLAFIVAGCKTLPNLDTPAQSLKEEPIVSLVDDVVPYTDAARECSVDAKGKQSGPAIRTRWLLSDAKGIAINLDEGYMVQRFPIGQNWENRRPAGKVDIQQTYGHLIPGGVGSSGFRKKDTYDHALHWKFAAQYAGLSDWRMITAEEVKGAFAPCMDSGYRFNQRIFPGLSAGKVAVVMDDRICSNPATPRGEFGSKLAKDYCSTANVPAFTFLARRLTKQENAGYQKVFQDQYKKGKPEKSLVLFNNGALIDGMLDAGGSGFGFMRYPTHKPQNDFAFNFYFGDFKGSKPHGQGQEIKNGRLFATSYENGTLIQESPIACSIQSEALVKAFRLLQPLGYTSAALGRSLSATMKVEQYWLGACPNGVPEGSGTFLLRGLSTGMTDNGASSAYILGNITMKKGVPNGDMSFMGLTSNGATASAMQTEFPGLSTYVFVKIENGTITRNYYEEQKKAIEKGIWKAVVKTTASVIADAYKYCKTNGCNNTPTIVDSSTSGKTTAKAAKAESNAVAIAQVRITGDGNPYKIECPNGSSRRIWRSSDNKEWRDASYGGIGLGHLSISELGERLCR